MNRLAGLIFAAALASGGIINTDSVNAALFNVSTFASGLALPTDITPLSSGPVLISISPGYGSSPGELQYFSANGTAGPTVYTSSFQGSTINGLMTGSVPLGNDLVVGIYGGLSSSPNTINILQPGATPSSALSVVASLQMNYSSATWEHNSIGLATEPTPGVPGSYNLVINVGSQFDNVATPAGNTVSLTGTGFSTAPAATLHGDSLYMLTIDTTGAQPTVTAIQQIATGIRNVYGMAFDSAGNLYFTDNGLDVLPPGSPQPVEPNGAPPQADELNMIPASQLGVGPPPDFGFPNCYIQYAFGGVPGVPVGSGCTQPLVAFQPLTDSLGTHELIGPTAIAFAPADFPAPFNDGIFIGFTGGGRPDEESGLVFYSFATGTYLNFIESSASGVTNILGVDSTNNALYVSDFGNGVVYEIQSAVPEPSTGVLAGFAFVLGVFLHMMWCGRPVRAGAQQKARNS